MTTESTPDSATSNEQIHQYPMPQQIPTGARVVVRRRDGKDAYTGRDQFRDAVGHVVSWNGHTLTLLRDESANGQRKAELINIDAATIVRIKPVPERPQRIHA